MAKEEALPAEILQCHGDVRQAFLVCGQKWVIKNQGDDLANAYEVRNGEAERNIKLVTSPLTESLGGHTVAAFSDHPSSKSFVNDHFSIPSRYVGKMTGGLLL